MRPDTVTTAEPAFRKPEALTLPQAASLPAEQVLARLAVTTQGLVSAEAARRLAAAGPNAVRTQAERDIAWWWCRRPHMRPADYADDQVERAVRAKRKGALAAYRDATLFKVIYAWGLRRTEASRLDVADWGRNPAVSEFGRYGMLHVRYGKGQAQGRNRLPVQQSR